MPKIYAKSWRKTAADEVIYRIHELRRHGKLKDINPREEQEIAEAIRSKFPTQTSIDTYQLYKYVFKPLGYKEGDLLEPEEIEEVGGSIGLKESDMESFRNQHGLSKGESEED